MQPETPPSSASGWRLPSSRLSLPEVHGSIAVPEGAGFWRKMFAFAGPGYLVAVGYMDPGNWATDLAGGARFGYTLLSVIMLSNFMAILLQALAARLGIASGRDLAQACRDSFSRPTTIVLWVLCEIAIAACDLAEVIGAAIALNLLFKIPLAVGVALTGLQVLLLLALQGRGMRRLEAVIVVPPGWVRTEDARAALPAEVPMQDAVFNVGHASLLVLGLAKGEWDLVARGLHDRLHQARRAHLYPESLRLAERATELGALGATISGAGPAVLFWTHYEQTGGVVEALRRAAPDAEVRRVPFEPQGAEVREL